MQAASAAQRRQRPFRSWAARPEARGVRQWSCRAGTAVAVAAALALAALSAAAPAVAARGRRKLQAALPPQPARPQQLRPAAGVQALQVRAEILHSWRGYERCAWGHDEARPVSCQAADWGAEGSRAAIGVTLIESLDTLWLSGLHDEFDKAVAYLASANHSFSVDAEVSVFELVIRVLGGLLSAYDLSGREVLLRKARDLGGRIIGALIGPLGFPQGAVHLGRGTGVTPQWATGVAALAELGSLQLELDRLSQLTGEPIYAGMGDRVTRLLLNAAPADGLWPVEVSPETGELWGKVTLGARGDSWIEYLLKRWVQGGGRDERLRAAFVRTVEAVLANLTVATPSGGTFVAERPGLGELEYKMDHLVCFFPGVLALAVSSRPPAVQAGQAVRWMDFAHRIAVTCREMYSSQPSGLAPNIVRFSRKRLRMFAAPGAEHNILRPEAVESWFVIYRALQPGDPLRERYRRWAWEAFESWRRHLRVPGGGYSGGSDVTHTPVAPLDKMESFWIAETLKYLWLITGSESELPLADWVLNTEAHPFRIQRGPAERAAPAG
eukprot:TRINITY_DN35185_c0_g1_i1.p1 TRINITY_DN35185_c0_g1~~TRINITY_DN35185_c0_g1_i1.p1  ORF type:complete len:583 (+),score=128.49 TRINITY_DN35185_c0_g1_i1:89-1750(+)